MPPPHPTELGPMLISWCFLWEIPCLVCEGFCCHLQESMEHWLRGSTGTGNTHQLIEGMYFQGYSGLWSSRVAEIHASVSVRLCTFYLLLAVPRQFIHASALSILDGVRKSGASWAASREAGRSLHSPFCPWDKLGLRVSFSTKLCHLGRGIMQVRENCFPDTLHCIYSWIFGSTEMLQTLS